MSCKKTAGRIILAFARRKKLTVNQLAAEAKMGRSNAQQWLNELGPDVVRVCGRVRTKVVRTGGNCYAHLWEWVA